MKSTEIRIITITILLALACATSVLLAQGPPKQPPDPATRAQHRVSFLTTVLSLTPAQQQQATSIFTNEANAETTIHDSMRAAHQNLHTAVRNNDTAGIDQLSSTIGNLMAQATALRAKADAALYQILTPDQQSKLSKLQSEGPGFHHGGPGLGGPGPH